MQLPVGRYVKESWMRYQLSKSAAFDCVFPAIVVGTIFSGQITVRKGPPLMRMLEEIDKSQNRIRPASATFEITNVLPSGLCRECFMMKGNLNPRTPRVPFH
jgi:hypothetical protein